MINKVRLREILADYKRDFNEAHWEAESFKWEAVQWFQDHWDIEAVDFPAMLERSLEKTGALLISYNHFPAGMIEGLSRVRPEEVRTMFRVLYDEEKDLYERIQFFKNDAERIFIETKDQAKNHFQDENVITTYLWLRYPERYYIYKFSEVRSVAKALHTSYQFKAGAYKDNLAAFWQLYDEINTVLRADSELRALLDRYLTEDFYPDPALHTMTIDVGFYISRQKNVVWEPVDYDPGLSVEDWMGLLADENVFHKEDLELLLQIQDCGGEASAKLLAETYGGKANAYNTASVRLAKRIATKTGCPLEMRSNGKVKYWPVLYRGRDAFKNEVGTFVWRLRDELAEALKRLDDAPADSDMSMVKEADVEDAVVAVSTPTTQQYWWLNANPKIWSFSEIKIGEEQYYTLLNENGNKRKIYQNFLDVKVGDKVIGYETTPIKQVVALAVISQEEDGSQIGFKKEEQLITPIDYNELKGYDDLSNAEIFRNPTGSLFKLTKNEYDFILDLVRERNPILESDKNKERAIVVPYTRADFLNEVYIDAAQFDRLLRVLERKKNIILQGAPGVGKTFAAKRLAYAMMGEKDESRIEFVQFHQNYTYEDFVMGYKPVGEGFDLKRGVFYEFCQKAANRPDKPFFFIIDEINRGNLSKIFGELLMAIEADYRGEAVRLAYAERPFAVPENLYIIGMMNTADRSLALIDYALRRRFSFFEMGPAFDTASFQAYQQGIGSQVLDALLTEVRALNRDIAQDPSLGRGFMIGHSYFCDEAVCKSAEDLRDIIEFDILPMLEEYWFDNEDKLAGWRERLRGACQ